MTIRSKNLYKIKIDRDREIHVRQVRIANREFVSIRDYVPSAKRDGNGITFPVEHFGEVLEALNDAGRSLINERGTPGPGQEALL